MNPLNDITGDTHMTDDLYERQQELDLETPEKVTVIGCGGVGSWVALDMALLGVEELYVVDFDVIEGHNLNRTPFKEMHVGMSKTDAIVDLIAERRLQADVNPVDSKIENVAGHVREDIEDSVIIDCRDTARPLPDGIEDAVLVTAGYDGREYTVHVNPDYGSIWGDGETEYETVPSYIAAPQLLAAAVTEMVASPDFDADTETVTSGTITDVLQLMTGGDE